MSLAETELGLACFGLVETRTRLGLVKLAQLHVPVWLN